MFAGPSSADFLHIVHVSIPDQTLMEVGSAVQRKLFAGSQQQDVATTAAEQPEVGGNAATARLPVHHGLSSHQQSSQAKHVCIVRRTALNLDTQQSYGNTGVVQPHQQHVPYTTACAVEDVSRPLLLFGTHRKAA